MIFASSRVLAGRESFLGEKNSCPAGIQCGIVQQLSEVL